MSRLTEIYDGWKNYVFPNEQVEKLAKKRIEICVNCDKLKANNTCSLCGCFMCAKVRSISSHCSIRKW